MQQSKKWSGQSMEVIDLIYNKTEDGQAGSCRLLIAGLLSATVSSGWWELQKKTDIYVLIWILKLHFMHCGFVYKQIKFWPSVPRS